MGGTRRVRVGGGREIIEEMGSDDRAYTSGVVKIDLEGRPLADGVRGSFWAPGVAMDMLFKYPTPLMWRT